MLYFFFTRGLPFGRVQKISEVRSEQVNEIKVFGNQWF
jgi:hypothetical protein